MREPRNSLLRILPSPPKAFKQEAESTLGEEARFLLVKTRKTMSPKMNKKTKTAMMIHKYGGRFVESKIVSFFITGL